MRLPTFFHGDRVPRSRTIALLTLAILLLVGAVASNFVGKRLLGWGDALVRRIPVVRSISFTRAAWAGLKLLARARRRAMAASENGASSTMPGRYCDLSNL